MKGEEILLSRQEFIRVSIEINLFFQRIMKEHMFFIETNLQPVEITYIAEATKFKQHFEQLLAQTVYYADGVVSEEALLSHEFVTPFTFRAEEVTTKLTGSRLNIGITRAEYDLESGANFDANEWLENVIGDINNRSCALLEQVIAFKKQLLDQSLECKIFITLYSEMLEHLIHEAEYYLRILKALQERNLPKETLCDELNFWNNIMAEHAQFIDGMLDPTEKGLKSTAATTATSFEKLVAECIKSAEEQIVQKSFASTQAIRDFKRSSTEGLLECKIKSIIPPLLADHVLREANHYLRLLKLMNR